LQQSMQPNPQVQQQQQAQFELAVQKEQAAIAALQAQAQESQSRIQQNAVETQLLPQEVEIKRIAALSKNLKEGSEDDAEFARRARVAELYLKEREIASKEKIVDKQMGESQ